MTYTSASLPLVCEGLTGGTLVTFKISLDLVVVFYCYFDISYSSDEPTYVRSN